MTTTLQASYRKTKTGEWVVYGPLAELSAATTVAVAKKDGSQKTETIDHLGKPFMADGVEMVYGYLAGRSTTPARSTGGWGVAGSGRGTVRCTGRSACTCFDCI